MTKAVFNTPFTLLCEK